MFYYFFFQTTFLNYCCRFVWNLGAGTKAITHNVEIETAYRLDRQECKAYEINQDHPLQDMRIISDLN